MVNINYIDNQGVNPVSKRLTAKAESFQRSLVIHPYSLGLVYFSLYSVRRKSLSDYVVKCKLHAVFTERLTVALGTFKILQTERGFVRLTPKS